MLLSVPVAYRYHDGSQSNNNINSVNANVAVPSPYYEEITKYYPNTYTNYANGAPAVAVTPDHYPGPQKNFGIMYASADDTIYQNDIVTGTGTVSQWAVIGVRDYYAVNKSPHVSGPVAMSAAYSHDNFQFPRVAGNLQCWYNSNAGAIYYKTTNSAPPVFKTALGTNEMELPEAHGAVYPDPATDVLHVQGGAERYRIDDVAGHLVQQGLMGLNGSIDISTLSRGLYMVYTEGGKLKDVEVSKFVKE